MNNIDQRVFSLAVFNYDLKPIERGYNNRTLYVNLSDSVIKSKPVSDEMKKKFIGGKGFDLWLLWNSLPFDRIVKWDDPENEVLISCGPLGGFSVFPGTGKSIAVSISPTTGSIIDSNVGGYFGPFLKFAGWDALEIQGKSDSEILVYIDGDEGKVSIEDASEYPSESYGLAHILHEKYGYKNVSVVSAGPGAEHTLIGCLNFSYYDLARKAIHFKQAGRGGLGTVFRNKKIKALVVKYSGVITTQKSNPADADRVQKVGRRYSKEIRELDMSQNQMSRKGSSFLVNIMSDFDLLPTNNFRLGTHPEADKISGEFYADNKFDEGFDGCWIGCAMACSHCVKAHHIKTGPYKGQKVWVDGPEYETIAGVGSCCGIFDPDHILEVNFYCDAYGIDTISFGTATAFAMECYESGLINKEATGGMDLSFGNKESAIKILHQMAEGEGFGVIIGQGVRRMKKLFHEKYGADLNHMNDIGMEAKGLEYSEYVTKESLAQQAGYGLALKGAQHDEAWLIFLDQVHNLIPSFDQKAEALYWFPMFRTWFGLNGLCKLPWNDVTPPENADTEDPAKVMPHVEMYAEFFSAVTGRESTPDDLIIDSERVYNLQRIFNLRQGYGKRIHDDIPYRSAGPVTEFEYLSRQERYDNQLKERGVNMEKLSTAEKMKLTRSYREEAYEILKDAVYKRRGWTNKGVITLERLESLGIDYPEVVKIIKKGRGIGPFDE